MAYAGNRLVDLRAMVGYDFFLGLGVQAGYRYQAIKLDDIDNVSAELSVGGAFVGVHANF